MQHLQDSSAANSHDDAPQPVVNKSGHADQRETDVVPDPPSSSMYPHTERRIASDNAPYTLAEFTQYYGPRIGQQMWQKARIHEETAPEPPQVATQPDTQFATQPAPEQIATSDAFQLAVNPLASNPVKKITVRKAPPPLPPWPAKPPLPLPSPKMKSPPPLPPLVVKAPPGLPPRTVPPEDDGCHFGCHGYLCRHCGSDSRRPKTPADIWSCEHAFACPACYGTECGNCACPCRTGEQDAKTRKTGPLLVKEAVEKTKEMLELLNPRTGDTSSAHAGEVLNNRRWGVRVPKKEIEAVVNEPLFTIAEEVDHHLQDIGSPRHKTFVARSEQRCHFLCEGPTCQYCESEASKDCWSCDHGLTCPNCLGGCSNLACPCGLPAYEVHFFETAEIRSREVHTLTGLNACAG